MSKILIVDDSIIVRRSIRNLIESETFHTIVAEAGNGHEACELYSTHKPDLVTMDISMPMMSGVEAVKAIREAAPDARIIMISSISEREMVLEALKAGACDFILKPIASDKLLEIINREIGAGTPPQNGKGKTVKPAGPVKSDQPENASAQEADPNKFL